VFFVTPGKLELIARQKIAGQALARFVRVKLKFEFLRERGRRYSKKEFLMKKAIATTIFAISTFIGSLGFAKPPTNFSALTGVWNNTNPGTGGIVRVVIRQTASGLFVQPFGACSPTPCDHGVLAARTFSPGVGSANGSGFNANKNFGFKSTAYNGILQGRYLSLLTQNTFASTDGRFNYTSLESFVRGSAADAP
jgi:hypothetical protein